MHRRHRGQLAAFAEGGKTVIAAYGFAPQRAQRVYDRALLGTAKPDQLVIWPSLDPPNGVGNAAATEVASGLAGTQPCISRYGFQLPRDLADFNSYLFTWLLDGGVAPDYTDGYNPFRTVTRPVVQQWIKTHDQQIAPCTVDLKTLPQ